MDKEMASLRKNETWTLIPKLENHKLVECKWLFKVKEDISNSELIKYEARLVAKGFTNFNEIFFTDC